MVSWADATLHLLRYGHGFRGIVWRVMLRYDDMSVMRWDVICRLEFCVRRTRRDVNVGGYRIERIAMHDQFASETCL
jgi:hypothetical protein